MKLIERVRKDLKAEHRAQIKELQKQAKRGTPRERDETRFEAIKRIIRIMHEYPWMRSRCYSEDFVEVSAALLDEGV